MTGQTAVGTGTAGKGRAAGMKRRRAVTLRSSQIYSFLTEMEKTGRTEATVAKYRGDLMRLYEFLGEEKLIYDGVLSEWKQSMTEDGYAGRTINASLTAANGLFSFIGCRDWQLYDWAEPEETRMQELTREEYRMLLREAKRQKDIRLYLMVKLLACTDLTPADLVLVTKEAAESGIVSGRMRGIQRDVRLPELLRKDLSDLAVRSGIGSGPVFLNDSRIPYGRTVIAKMVASLGADIGLEPGKANPRNLRRLYQNTLEGFEEQAAAWIAERYGNLLLDEEKDCGWRLWYVPESGRLTAQETGGE